MNEQLNDLLLQTVTVLVRDVKTHMINNEQLQVLLGFCEEDLYNYTRQSSTFTLLKVLYYCIKLILGDNLTTPISTPDV